MVGVQLGNQVKRSATQLMEKPHLLEKMAMHSLMKKRTYSSKKNGSRTKLTIDISRNENPYGASPYALQAAKRALKKNSHQYPDPTSTLVRQKLGETHNIDPNQIVVAPGSEAILNTLPNAFLTGGGLDTFAFPALSFYRYQEIVHTQGVPYIKSREAVDTGVSMNSLFFASRMDDVAVVQLANPSNPTGLIIDKDRIVRFLDTMPSNILFVYDAAYAEFCKSPDYTDGVELVQNYPNVLVLKTLSKAYGLAGMRVGYGVSSQENIDRINSVRSQYWMSAHSQAAAVEALNDVQHLNDSEQTTVEVRENFQQALDTLNLPYTPSHANFVLVEFGRDGWPGAEIVNNLLKRRGIIVRPMAETYGLGNHLRFSIGTMEQMHDVCNALQEIKRLSQYF